MKISELRDLTEAELAQAKDEAGKELFNLRLQQSLGQLEKPTRIRELRRQIARINTVGSQRANGGKETADV